MDATLAAAHVVDRCTWSCMTQVFRTFGAAMDMTRFSHLKLS